MIQGSTIPLLRFELLREISHGISSRRGGVSRAPFDTLNLGYSTKDLEQNVRQNRLALAREMGVDPSRIASGRLSHGADVTVVRRGSNGDGVLRTAPVRPGSSHRQTVFPTDAVVSDVPGQHFLITCGDCVPLAFFDRRLEIVGAAHAGWRGTAAGIAINVVRTLRAAFGTDPADLLVGIGPSIGPCCYSVSPQVLAVFRSNGLEPVVRRRTPAYLDLWKTNADQLISQGVPARSIENPFICTSCNADAYFSHRAHDGQTGRFALCLGKQ